MSLSGSTLIAARTPAALPGLVDVTVTNPDAESAVLVDGFDYQVLANSDLSVSKTDDVDPVEAGSSFVYVISVANQGPGDAADVVVEDVLPAGLTLLSTAGCAEDPFGVPTCSLGTIPAGLSAEYTIAVTTDSDITGLVTNQATVSSVSVNDPYAANNVDAEETEIQEPANTVPVANAGSDQPNVLTGALVTLDGSESSDGDGDPLTYAWTLTTQPTGSTAELSNPVAQMPTFTADLAGTYQATLVVNDGTEDSAADTVAITATDANPILQSISVSPTSPSIEEGQTQQFTATGTYSDSTTQDLTNAVSWSSSNAAVATIGSGGLATSVQEGNTNITADLDGVTSNAASLIVTLPPPPTLESIAVSPTSPSIDEGQTQQFTATGTYSNSTTQDLTTSVAWASSNNAVATINGSGLAGAVSAGGSDISASLDGVTSNVATLTVTAPSTISLSVNAYKNRGRQKADLTWDGATTSSVVIHRRNGSGGFNVIATTANDGAYTDNIDLRGSGSYTYKLCETGTAAPCSDEVGISF